MMFIEWPRFSQRNALFLVQSIIAARIADEQFISIRFPSIGKDPISIHLRSTKWWLIKIALAHYPNIGRRVLQGGLRIAFPEAPRKSTVRNAKLADFGVVFGKSVLSKLNSSLFAMGPSRYRPSEIV